MLQWVGQEGVELTNSTERNIVIIQSANGLSLIFDPVESSHERDYICIAMLRDDLVNVSVSANATSSVMNISKNS